MGSKSRAKSKKLASKGSDELKEKSKFKKVKNVKTVKTVKISYDTEELNTIYNNKKQFEGVMRKYWAQRNNLFSKYDEGILLTKELWFSVTPELMSKFIAKFINFAFKDLNRQLNILDAFCGGGGNINQFLEFNNKIFAVDINHLHLHCTHNNAKIYFDEERIQNNLKLIPLNWIYADNELDDKFIDEEYEQEIEDDNSYVDKIYANKYESLNSFEILSNNKFDCVFGSPPWGGPEYIKQEIYDLNNLLPYNLEKMLKIMMKYSSNICLFLPKNSDKEQLIEITGKIFKSNRNLRIIEMSVDGYVKGKLCCWGEPFCNLNLRNISIK